MNNNSEDEVFYVDVEDKRCLASVKNNEYDCDEDVYKVEVTDNQKIE